MLLDGPDGYCIFNTKDATFPLSGPLTIKIVRPYEEVDARYGSYDLGPMRWYNKPANMTITGAQSKYPCPLLQPGCLNADVRMQQPKEMARYTSCKLVCVFSNQVAEGIYEFKLTDDFNTILKCWHKTQPPPQSLKLEDIGTLQSETLPNWLREFHEATCRRTKLFDLIQTSYGDNADTPTYLEKL